MVTFTTAQTLKAQTEKRRIATLSLSLVKTTPGPLYPREREAAPSVEEDTFDMYKHCKTIISLPVLLI